MTNQFSGIERRSGKISPDDLTTDEIRGWCKHSSWTASQAICVLHGKKPRPHSENWRDELHLYFFQANVLLEPALATGAVGKELAPGSFHDTPENWIAWAHRSELHIHPDVRTFFGHAAQPSNGQTSGAETSTSDVVALSHREEKKAETAARDKDLQTEANDIAKQFEKAGKTYTKDDVAAELKKKERFRKMSVERILKLFNLPVDTNPRRPF